MKTLTIADNWDTLKDRLKWNFRHLSDKDLTYVKGKEEELISRLQQKLGTRRQDVIEILSRI